MATAIAKKSVRKTKGTTNSKTAKSTKVTFVLPVELACRVKEAVAAGAFESQNALARAAIEREVKRVRDEEIAQAMRDAANDPLFMADLEECMRDWAELDADANRFVDIGPHYPEEETTHSAERS